METLINIAALTGMSLGYFLIFAHCKKGRSGYLIVACCCLILSVTYAWKSYAAATQNEHITESHRH